MLGYIIVLLLIIFGLILVASCVKIVPQAHALVIERLGGYQGTWGVGLHFKVPFIDRVAKRVLLKEQVVDFAPQPVITKDNVTMRIDTVVYFQITDPKLFAYGVENPIMAIENLTATTLRNIIGDLELDETLTSRELINTKMRASLDVATDPWGIKVNRVELKNIIPPQQIQDAMEKQAKAERERRAAVTQDSGCRSGKTGGHSPGRGEKGSHHAGGRRPGRSDSSDSESQCRRPPVPERSRAGSCGASVKESGSL